MMTLTAAWAFSYAKFEKHFADPKLYVSQIHRLEKEVAQERAKQILLHDQILQFRTEVATVLPELLKKNPSGEKGYPMRNLASVTGMGEADQLRARLASMQFEKAKKYFRLKDFSTAQRTLDEFIRKSPFSIHIAEAYFLLAETYYRLEDYESSILTVEKMVELFPEHELTGFSLLRVGKIYEYKDRPEEAVDIYKAVLKTFPHRGVASQARESLRSVEL